jgi:hypothetical protein
MRLLCLPSLASICLSMQFQNNVRLGCGGVPPSINTWRYSRQSAPFQCTAHDQHYNPLLHAAHWPPRTNMGLIMARKSLTRAAPVSQHGPWAFKDPCTVRMCAYHGEAWLTYGPGHQQTMPQGAVVALGILWRSVLGCVGITVYSGLSLVSAT